MACPGEHEQHRKAQHGNGVGEVPHSGEKSGGDGEEADAEPDGELACTTFALPVSKSTQSGHFKALREAGVIRQRDEGTRRLNRLRRDDLDARFPGLLDLVIPQGREVIAGW
ncbi:ArsR/SmtB family transcription factor [Streptosporangium carneum]|uniref:Transcriptional regulator n=1 Tax=Streptosporangium carneum TaxID=47481 RepID=A0A9W6I9I7_9ACTN|nr:helix-turn-helix domain-containing protein [Streptosporangium carneum]GLK13474.1 hypothetical protein GCM10017600_68850 [Streptosporangium carneum]